MYSALAGDVPDISPAVAKKFTEHDTGGKLPAKVGKKSAKKSKKKAKGK